jgi:hypothetical protein
MDTYSTSHERLAGRNASVELALVGDGIWVLAHGEGMWLVVEVLSVCSRTGFEAGSWEKSEEYGAVCRVLASEVLCASFVSYMIASPVDINSTSCRVRTSRATIQGSAVHRVPVFGIRLRCYSIGLN